MTLKGKDMKEQLNESDRLLFVKGSASRYRNLRNRLRNVFPYLILAIGFGSFSYHLAVYNYQKGLEQGKRIAIDPRNPSQELELACAGLWVGEQNKKYLQKNPR